MTWLARPSLALGFGGFFLCAVTCTHTDELAAAPLSVVPDLTAGMLLIGAAIVSGRDWRGGRPFQIAAWAFMVSLLLGSFLGNLQEWGAHAPEASTSALVSIPEGPYLAIVGALFVLSLGGLIVSLQARPD